MFTRKTLAITGNQLSRKYISDSSFQTFVYNLIHKLLLHTFCQFWSSLRDSRTFQKQKQMKWSHTKGKFVFLIMYTRQADSAMSFLINNWNRNPLQVFNTKVTSKCSRSNENYIWAIRRRCNFHEKNKDKNCFKNASRCSQFSWDMANHSILFYLHLVNFHSNYSWGKCV